MEGDKEADTISSSLENDPSSDPVEDTVSDVSESYSESTKDFVNDKKNDKAPKKKECVSQVQTAAEEEIPKGPQKLDTPTSREKSIPIKDSSNELESTVVQQKPIIKEQPKAIVQDISPQPKQAIISSKDELGNISEVPKNTSEKLESQKGANKALENTVFSQSIKKEQPKVTVQDALPKPKQAIISPNDELVPKSETVSVPHVPKSAEHLELKKERLKATVQDALPKPKQAIISPKDEMVLKSESDNVPVEKLESTKVLEGTTLKKSVKKEQPKATVQDVSPQPKQAVVSKNIEMAQKTESDNTLNARDTPEKVTSKDSSKTTILEKAIVQEQPKVQDISKKPNQAVISTDDELTQKRLNDLDESNNYQTKMDEKPAVKPERTTVEKINDKPGENKNLLSAKPSKSPGESRDKEVAVEPTKDDRTALKPVTKSNADSKKQLKPIQVHCPQT
jgi:hypothetical protein